MGRFTRWAPLLVNVMSDELRNKFFADDDSEVDIDANWELFEVTHPKEAEILFEVLTPLLEGIKVELQFKRDHQKLLAAGKEMEAARLRINHQANQLNW